MGGYRNRNQYIGADMDNNLTLLADKLGIARHFYDAGLAKKSYAVDEKILKFFCSEFGFKADTPEEAAASLKRLEEHSWKTVLENILVLKSTNLRFEIALEKKHLPASIKLYISMPEDNKEQEAHFEISPSGSEKEIGRTTYQKYTIQIKDKLAFGYYNLKLETDNKTYRSVLACVPDKCYTSDIIENGGLWGYSLQLYALKSQHNWGIGDFTDLKHFVKMCADAGADIIGLNPLNVLFHDFPENASPYSSISRLFLNPIYIDVEALPCFNQSIRNHFSEQIFKAKNSDLIDYTTVYDIKMAALRQLFDDLDIKGKYYKDFLNFKKEKGCDLEMLATYQALYHEQCQHIWGGFNAWDKNLKNPHSLQVAKFKKEHAQEIEFFKFLQFEADRQLKSVYAKVQECGLKIGLYRDLPVGVCKDSAELWSDRYVFMNKSGAGAPPDAFFPCGQKWCLGAFNPYELKNRAYEPFLKILRANMAYAGALRIDHVMGLMRLFMIPDDQENGTYIHYNFDDMLGLLALESHLHKCAIVGESIGNVPEGFLDKLKEQKIYSISVLWAERWDGGRGDFKMPRDYPEDAFVSVGTHDMAPLKMWWFGYEIELMHNLKMLNDQERLNAYKQREADRRMLLAAMDFNQVWPEDKCRRGDYLYGENFPEGLEEAVHKLICNAKSKVVLLQLEDIFGVDVLQNLPGTDRDKYPNWRRRLPVNLEDMEKHTAYIRNTNLMKREK